RGETVNDLVIPLVTNCQSPLSAGNACELEVPIGIALGEHEILGVRVAEADPALSPRQRIAGAAGVESLVRRPAETLDIHLPLDGVGAGAGGAVGAGADGGLAVIDDLRVGKADAHVVSARPELLEVARLANADEGIVGVLAIQRVGLEPFFAARNPVGPRV